MKNFLFGNKGNGSVGEIFFLALIVLFELSTVSANFLPGVAYEMYNSRKNLVLGVSYDYQDKFMSPSFCAYAAGKQPDGQKVEVRRAAFFIEKNPLHPQYYQVIEAKHYFYLHRSDSVGLDINGPYHNVGGFQDGQHIDDTTGFWEFISNDDVFDEYTVSVDGLAFVMETPDQPYPIPNPVFAAHPGGGVLKESSKWRIYMSMMNSKER